MLKWNTDPRNPTMTARRRHYCPHLECLEGRDTPSNLTVSFSAMTHTLTVVGNSAGNTLTVQGVAADPTRFTLFSPSDTFNGGAGPFTTPTGVRNITIRLLGGNDTVTISNAVPIDLKGNLSINGGSGANSVTTTDLTVEGNFSIINGTNASGQDANQFQRLTVGGSLTINDGTGDSLTRFSRDSVGVSAIGGNLSITNGSGSDDTRIIDMNVGGSVTINNGRGNEQTRSAGVTQITNRFNQFNTGARGQIRGNVSVSYLDGDSVNLIEDTDIHGNATFNHGPGSATTMIDGNFTALPVVVRGSLTFAGTGANTIEVGNGLGRTGLIVGRNLTVTTSAAADTLYFNKLEVDGATRFVLGDGNNSVGIDDSLFAGAFTLTTGAGNDQVSLDPNPGAPGPTTFGGRVLIVQGAGADQVVRAGTSAASMLIVLDTFVIHHGTGRDETLITPGHEIFLFGGLIQYVF
jgi:hypothetical protein